MPFTRIGTLRIVWMKFYCGFHTFNKGLPFKRGHGSCRKWTESAFAGKTLEFTRLHPIWSMFQEHVENVVQQVFLPNLSKLFWKLPLPKDWMKLEPVSIVSKSPPPLLQTSVVVNAVFNDFVCKNTISYLFLSRMNEGVCEVWNLRSDQTHKLQVRKSFFVLMFQRNWILCCCFSRVVLILKALFGMVDWPFTMVPLVSENMEQKASPQFDLLPPQFNQDHS